MFVTFYKRCHKYKPLFIIFFLISLCKTTVCNIYNLVGDILNLVGDIYKLVGDIYNLVSTYKIVGDIYNMFDLRLFSCHIMGFSIMTSYTIFHRKVIVKFTDKEEMYILRANNFS